MAQAKFSYLIIGTGIALLLIYPSAFLPVVLGNLAVYALFAVLKSVAENEPNVQKTKKKRQKQRQTTQQANYCTSNDALTRDIIRLSGSKAVAERLIRNCRQKYPEKTEKWRKEKIIYDFKRDRGRI